MVGVAIRRQLCGSGAGPSRDTRVQSMASRKHTTASPEKSPIKTASNRKKRSSREVLRVNQDRLPRLRAEPSAGNEGGKLSLAGAPGPVIVPLRCGPEKEEEGLGLGHQAFHRWLASAARFRKPGP